MILTPGVAKDSSMVEASVDLNARYEVTIAQLQSHVDNSINQDVANLSLGIAMPAGETWASIKSAMDADAEGVFSWNKGTRTIKPVYVISAGNNGVGCAAGEMVQCNYLAALALLDPDIGGQTIVAGATTTDGGKKIATYSNRAGVMMDRYLLASGDTGFYLLNGTHVRGTSFSAPRISGAAALLKSKFPNLSGANVSDILLLTADKDIDDNGIDDFSSVSAIYGRGELDLSSALSPVGNLTP
jgi:subtilisin family serine protease